MIQEDPSQLHYCLKLMKIWLCKMWRMASYVAHCLVYKNFEMLAIILIQLFLNRIMLILFPRGKVDIYSNNFKEIMTTFFLYCKNVINITYTLQFHCLLFSPNNSFNYKSRDTSLSDTITSAIYNHRRYLTNKPKSRLLLCMFHHSTPRDMNCFGIAEL